MTAPPIRIVAALVQDGMGRMLLVRKRGTVAFMQPGGKLEAGEAPLVALARELIEEIGCGFNPGTATPLGLFRAPAANEPGRMVEALLYEIEITGSASARAEIDALVWVDPAQPGDVSLAPLTRDHVLPLAAARRAR